jgi:hypothetical protein
MSQRMPVGYAMRAAQAAKGSGTDAGLAIAMIGEAHAPHARPAVTGRAPLAGDRIGPKALPKAPQALWRATRRPPARQVETQALDDHDMLDAAPDLEETKSRLAEAADALRRLSMNGIKPSGLRARWPDIVQRAEEAYGWTAERMRPPRRRRSPAWTRRLAGCSGSMRRSASWSGRARWDCPGARSRISTAAPCAHCRICSPAPCAASSPAASAPDVSGRSIPARARQPPQRGSPSCVAGR